MSVLFDIRDYEWPVDEDGYHFPPASMYLNITNANAGDFFRWLGLEFSECGEIPARELAALLRRRLWPSNRQRGDHGREGSVDARPNGLILIDGAREPGRLAQYAERLLALAEHAGDGTIIWH